MANKKAFDFARNSIYVADPMDLSIVGGARVFTGPELGPLDTEHRKGDHDLYDVRIEEQLTEEFVLSIDAFGVMQPVSVAKLEDGRPVVVAGRQRVRAARIVNARRAARGEKPVSVQFTVVRRAGNSLLSAMIAENEARRDDSPMVKLEKLRGLLARGVSIEDAALAFCVTVQYAKQLLAFDDTAAPAVKAAAESGRLSLTAATEIAKVRDPAKQNEALAEVLATPGKVTVKAAQRVAAQVKGKTVDVGLIPSRREVAKVLKAVSDGSTEATQDARTLLDGGEVEGHIEQRHVVDAYYLGVEAALKLVLGKADDKGLIDLLRAARGAK